MNEYLIIILLTLTPLLELRAAIPYAILGTSIPTWAILSIVILINIILGTVAYFLIHTILHYVLRVPLLKKWYDIIAVRSHKRAQKYVNRWGTLGLALFIAIPLPGSGVYTGTLVANLLNIRFRNFLIATILGVTLASVLVTLVVLSGNTAWGWIFT